jgi:hypothetical protein
VHDANIGSAVCPLRRPPPMAGLIPAPSPPSSGHVLSDEDRATYDDARSTELPVQPWHIPGTLGKGRLARFREFRARPSDGGGERGVRLRK